MNIMAVHSKMWHLKSLQYEKFSFPPCMSSLCSKILKEKREKKNSPSPSFIAHTQSYSPSLCMRFALPESSSPQKLKEQQFSISRMRTRDLQYPQNPKWPLHYLLYYTSRSTHRSQWLKGLSHQFKSKLLAVLTATNSSKIQRFRLPQLQVIYAIIDRKIWQFKLLLSTKKYGDCNHRFIQKRNHYIICVNYSGVNYGGFENRYNNKK